MLRDGEPCKHPGCLIHISHPCEGCGRVGGQYANGTYGGITRSSEPFYRQGDDTGGVLTMKIIEEFFSPERFERERQAEMEVNRQRAEFMYPYVGAPPSVYAAAWRVALSSSAPLHPEEYKRLKAILDEWKGANDGKEVS